MSKHTTRHFTDDGDDSYMSPSLPSRGSTENLPPNSRDGGEAPPAQRFEGSRRRSDQAEKDGARYYRHAREGAAASVVATVTPGAVAARGPRQAFPTKSADEGMPPLPAPTPRATATRTAGGRSQQTAKERARASGAAVMPGAYSEEPPSDDEAENRNEGQYRNAARIPTGVGEAGAMYQLPMKGDQHQLVEHVEGPNFEQSQDYNENVPQQFISSASRDVAVAAHVVPDEQDIEKQVQARVYNEREEIAAQVQKQLMDQAVHADVMTNEDNMDYDSGGRSDNNRTFRNRMLLLGLVGVLVVVGIVVVLVVVLGKSDNNPPPPTSPSPPPGEVRCGTDAVGLVSCAVDDAPLSTTVTVFSSCTENQPSACQQCVIFLEDTIDGLNPTNDPRCQSCSVCEGGTGATEFDCSNLYPGDPCAKKDCNGNCIGGADNRPTQAPVPVPAPTSPTDETNFDTPPGTPFGTFCGATDDGRIVCGTEDYPRPRHVTGYVGCTENNGVVDPFQCERCVVWFADSFSDLEEAPACTSCDTCGSSISFDCSNFNENDQCSEQDCNGNCIGPPPAPVCGTTDDGDVVCGVDDTPKDGYYTVFGGCTESGGETNAFDCDICVITVADSIDDLDVNAPQCSSCTTCGDTIAFDCSNLEPNEECMVKDCSGNCIGSV